MPWRNNPRARTDGLPVDPVVSWAADPRPTCQPPTQHMKQPGSNSNRPTAIRSIALAALSTVLLATPVHAAAPLDGARLQESADRAAAGSYREWVDLLALPNDATVPADIQKNASWLVNAFTRHGFAARELANGNKPSGSWPRPRHTQQAAGSC